MGRPINKITAGFSILRINNRLLTKEAKIKGITKSYIIDELLNERYAQFHKDKFANELEKESKKQEEEQAN